MVWQGCRSRSGRSGQGRCTFKSIHNTCAWPHDGKEAERASYAVQSRPATVHDVVVLNVARCYESCFLTAENWFKFCSCANTSSRWPLHPLENFRRPCVRVGGGGGEYPYIKAYLLKECTCTDVRMCTWLLREAQHWFCNNVIVWVQDTEVNKQMELTVASNPCKLSSDVIICSSWHGHVSDDIAGLVPDSSYPPIRVRRFIWSNPNP